MRRNVEKPRAEAFGICSEKSEAISLNDFK
jgi:hypothetical protein